MKFKDTDFFLSPSGIFVSGARDGAQLAEKGTNANYGGSAAERGVGLNLKVWIKVKGNWMGGGELIQSSKIKAISGVVAEAHNLRVVYVWV